MIWGAAKAIWKGNWGGIVDGITKPWKDLWKNVKDLFTGKAFKDSFSEVVWDNPVEQNEEQAKDTNIAVRNLNMKGGKVESNLKHFNIL